MIELGIALVVMALLLGAGLVALNSQIEERRISATREKMSNIKVALRSFVAKTGRLPCPALRGLAPGASGYGVEAEAKDAVPPVPGPPAPATCKDATVSGSGFVGIVPWVTLGMVSADANDGWGRRLSYQVSADGVFAGGRRRPIEVSALMRGDIRLHSGSPPGPGLYDGASNAAGNQINGCSKQPADTNTCNSYAIALLVSHGKNGSGAWQENGTRIGVPAPGSVERNNTDDDSSYVEVEYRDSGNAQHFDDLVVAMPPGDLLAPLVHTGQVLPENVALKAGPEAIKYQIISFASDKREGTPPDVSYPLPENGTELYALLANNFGKDQWGNDFDYSSTVPKSGSDPYLWLTKTMVSGVAYTLKSPGPDNDIDTIADNPPEIKVYVEELRQIWLKNGL